MCNRIFRWPSNTHSAIGCSRPTRDRVSRPINSSFPGPPRPAQAAFVFVPRASPMPATTPAARLRPQKTVLGVDPPGNESARFIRARTIRRSPISSTPRDLVWRYYTPGPDSIWTGPNAIQHLCGPMHRLQTATACIGSDWVNHVVIYTTERPAPILTDIANGQLPTVSWVIPASKNSDHAGSRPAPAVHRGWPRL